MRRRKAKINSHGRCSRVDIIDLKRSTLSSVERYIPNLSLTSLEFTIVHRPRIYTSPEGRTTKNEKKAVLCFTLELVAVISSSTNRAVVGNNRQCDKHVRLDRWLASLWHSTKKKKKSLTSALITRSIVSNHRYFSLARKSTEAIQPHSINHRSMAKKEQEVLLTLT